MREGLLGGPAVRFAPSSMAVEVAAGHERVCPTQRLYVDGILAIFIGAAVEPSESSEARSAAGHVREKAPFGSCQWAAPLRPSCDAIASRSSGVPT
jgi:hypothetical protein